MTASQGSQPSPLHASLQNAIADGFRKGMIVRRVDVPPPTHAPDFFSNDYLSLSIDSTLMDTFLRKVQVAPRLFGSTGSRLLTGNSAKYIALERAFQDFFKSPSALLFSSGFSANSAFLGTVPQKNDVIIYDELIHMSCREGIQLSPCASYRFAHNSAVSFQETLLGVLQKHPQITRGSSTVFVSVESLYSMDGDFCPLTEIVGIVESLVPAEHAHIIVDEAHTSGICGPNGTGYVSGLGLNDRVHTKVHTFGKAWGFHGAVVLTSPIIRGYLVNFARGFMFSTAMSYTDIYALESCLGVLSGARGQELRRRLHRISRYAHEKLSTSLRNVPRSVLAMGHTSDAATTALTISEQHVFSPIIPVLAPSAVSLAEHLLHKGYAVNPITYPAVIHPRIRVIVHAGNTEAEIDAFVDELLAWAARATRKEAGAFVPVQNVSACGREAAKL